MLHRRFVLSLAVAAAAVSGAHAQHFDVLVARDAGGKLATGSADFDAASFTIGLRLWTRDLVSGFSSDPGFNAVSQGNVPAGYLALPGNAPLGFDIVRFPIFDSTPANLWHWDGVDDDGDLDWSDNVRFAPVADGTSLGMTIFGAGGGAAAATGANVDVVGPTIQLTSSTGAVHRHPSYDLLGPAPEGMYLLSLRLTLPGLVPSDPIFLLFATDAVSLGAYDAANAWADAHLLLPGDVNNDATVDIFDVAVVSGRWGQTGPNGDANYDGAVDIFDVATISSNWGATPAMADARHVPEPATAFLAAMALAAAAIARRRR